MPADSEAAGRFVDRQAFSKGFTHLLSESRQGAHLIRYDLRPSANAPGQIRISRLTGNRTTTAWPPSK